MTVPHITIEQAIIMFPATFVAPSLRRANELIDKANVEQSQEPYITADEARALGAGKAEYSYDPCVWHICWQGCEYLDEFSGKKFKYRAIRKEAEPAFKEVDLAGAIARMPEPSEPHAELKALYAQQVKDGTLDDFIWRYSAANGRSWGSLINITPSWGEGYTYQCIPKIPTCQVRNLDTGELKTMPREAAKLLQAELGDTAEWFDEVGYSAPPACIMELIAGKSYTYKLKANLVKLDGELMTRDAVIAKCKAVKDKQDVWYKSNQTNGFEKRERVHFDLHNATGKPEYQLRAKQLKQVSWSSVPVGVMTDRGEFRGAIVSAHGELLIRTEKELTLSNTGQWWSPKDVELAPASEQKWRVYIQGETDLDKLIGLEIEILCVDTDLKEFTHAYASVRRDSIIKAYRITGLAEGYELK